MAKADFSDYLSKPVDEIEAPKPLPAGHYLATFKSYKTAERDYQKATGGPKTPVVELTFALDSACDDIDGDIPDNLAGRMVTKDYTLNEEQGLFNLKRFSAEICDIDTKGLGLGDALDACKGSIVKVFNEPRPGKEEGVFYTNITRVLKAD